MRITNEAGFSPASSKARNSATGAPGDYVDIGWGWQGFSAFVDILEIQVDRGDGKGWVFLTYDTTPNYTDTFPLPATPTKWKYRAIYRVGDAQVGVWSNVVEITVGG